jgi:hypothetical protein
MRAEKAMVAHPVAVSVATVMGKVWPEQAQQAQLVINVALLGRDLAEITDESPAIDIG